MTMRRRSRFSSLVVLLRMLIGAHHASAGTTGEWNFMVLLEGDPIGRQTFRIDDEGPRRRVSIEASMEVKLLFLTVYSYRHKNVEVWEDGCLASIESDTDDNGARFRIRGKREGDALAVDTGKAYVALPGCVRSFAYWDPEMLRQTRLLNSQTGEYQAVQLREAGEEVIAYRGGQQRARRVALEGPELHIDLWYSSADKDWLALESKSKNGRIIRYVRQ